MSHIIHINNLLDHRQSQPAADIAPFLRAVIQKKGGTPRRSSAQSYWPETYFGLDRLSLWQDLAPESQQRVLRSLNQILLEESFYIEKSGMTYTAKMSLLAESNDERSLYGMLAADEAVHFQLISSYLLNEPQPYETQPFLVLLDEVVHHGSFAALIFIAQVLLEGWGLSHYMSLLKNSQNEELSNLLRMILNDEAIHHGSGIVMTQKHPLQGADLEMVKDILARFFELVRLGPTRVAGTLAQEMGGLSKTDFTRLFDDINADQQIVANLTELTKLVANHSPDDELTEFLDRNKLNRPVDRDVFAASMKGLS